MVSHCRDSRPGSHALMRSSPGRSTASAAFRQLRVGQLRAAGRKIIVNPGGAWTPLVMNTNTPPYNDARVRLAMKLLIDRKKAIQAATGGFAEIGNDLFSRHDPLYASSIPQRAYDPEKAASLLKAAAPLISSSPCTHRMR